MHIAERMNKVPAYFLAEQQKKIKQLKEDGKDIISLDIGSPDMPPSKAIIDTLCESAQNPRTHGYQAHNGTKELRYAWAEMYQREFNVTLDPDQNILPLLGTKEGIFHLMQALINPNDIVLLPDPGYPTYLRSVLFAGGKPFYMPLLPENGFLPDLKKIPTEIANQASILWINYPNNPTGASAPLGFYQDIVAFAQEYDILICHDAAYSQVYFGEEKPVSLLQVPEAESVGVEFNSLSKTYNMAGWRLGAVLGNPEVVKALLTLKTNLDSGHFLPILRAATSAITGDQSWIAERNAIYQRRTDLVVDSLLKIGFKTQKPDATFYVWVKTPDNQTSMHFVKKLLEACHISVTPGIVYGEGGKNYFRIALSQPEDRLKEAMRRIETAKSLLDL